MCVCVTYTCVCIVGDPDIRRSLRYIARATQEVKDKSRHSHEISSARKARIDQYSQLAKCERDGEEVSVWIITIETD